MDLCSKIPQNGHRGRQKSSFISSSVPQGGSDIIKKVWGIVSVADLWQHMQNHIGAATEQSRMETAHLDNLCLSFEPLQSSLWPSHQATSADSNGTGVEQKLQLSSFTYSQIELILEGER